ncbi:hypothetical protein CW354_08290 [Marinicaulis flavus]|uniref:Uncharacterized protein n=2 Tax=Hyphococcus luteus TaxID=2058213 RepID=A0A2S7K758_9PROT|nr:hypothetical protein CW354_08290 [Marinicaulis flavus]
MHETDDFQFAPRRVTKALLGGKQSAKPQNSLTGPNKVLPGAKVGYMMPRKSKSIGLALATLILAGCVHGGATAPFCRGNALAWVREAEESIDFQERYNAFDRQMTSLIAELENRKRVGPDEVEAYDAALYRQAQETIELLSGLLPLIGTENGDPDLSELADRIYVRELDIPEASDAETMMRVAFAAESLDAFPDAGKRVISFLTDLDFARNLLAAAASGHATPAEQDALRELPRMLLETYQQDFRPTLEITIYGAHLTDLSTRLAAQLRLICTERETTLVIVAQSAADQEKIRYD